METRRSLRIKEKIKHDKEESSLESESGSNSEERKNEDNSKQKRSKDEKEKREGRKKKKGKKKRHGTHGWTKGKDKGESESGGESSGEEEAEKESAFLTKFHLKKLREEGNIEKRQRSARLQAEEDELNRKPMTVEEMEEERIRKRESVKVLERPNLT